MARMENKFLHRQQSEKWLYTNRRIQCIHSAVGEDITRPVAFRVKFRYIFTALNSKSSTSDLCKRLWTQLMNWFLERPKLSYSGNNPGFPGRMSDSHWVWWWFQGVNHWGSWIRSRIVSGSTTSTAFLGRLDHTFWHTRINSSRFGSIKSFFHSTWPVLWQNATNATRSHSCGNRKSCSILWFKSSKWQSLGNAWFQIWAAESSWIQVPNTSSLVATDSDSPSLASRVVAVAVHGGRVENSVHVSIHLPLGHVDVDQRSVGGAELAQVCGTGTGGGSVRRGRSSRWRVGAGRLLAGAAFGYAGRVLAKQKHHEHQQLASAVPCNFAEIHCCMHQETVPTIRKPPSSFAVAPARSGEIPNPSSLIWKHETR